MKTITQCEKKRRVVFAMHTYRDHPVKNCIYSPPSWIALLDFSVLSHDA